MSSVRQQKRLRRKRPNPPAPAPQDPPQGLSLRRFHDGEQGSSLLEEALRDERVGTCEPSVEAMRLWVACQTPELKRQRRTRVLTVLNYIAALIILGVSPLAIMWAGVQIATHYGWIK